jgi:hypothetical protein
MNAGIAVNSIKGVIINKQLIAHLPAAVSAIDGETINRKHDDF